MNTQSDNLPTIVAVSSGVIFILISVVTAMTTSVGAKGKVGTQQNQSTATSSFLQMLAPDIDIDGQSASKQDERRATTSMSNRCNPLILNQNLQRGDSGAAVLALQKFLNADPETRISQSGPGAPGQETGYYGPLTAQAVQRFKNQHLGSVSTATGGWGLQARMQARKICADANTTSQSENKSSGGTNNQRTNDQASGMSYANQHRKAKEQTLSPNSVTSSTSSHTAFTNYRELKARATDNEELKKRITKRDKLFGGEAFVSDFDLQGGYSVREGSTGEVAHAEFSVKQGDILVERVDISFVHTGSTDDEPWEVFQRVSIKREGEEIAAVDASQEDNWIDEGSDYDGTLEGEEKFTIRLSNLNQIIKSGRTGQLSITVTPQAHVDEAGREATWGVFVDDSGIRAVDEIGVQHQIGKQTDPVQFTIRKASEYRSRYSTLDVRKDYASPDSSVIPVRDNSRSDAFSIFAFQIRTRSVRTAIERMTLHLDIQGKPAEGNDRLGYGDIVDEAAIKIGDNIFTADEITTTSGQENKSTAKLLFLIDEKITLEEYNSKTARLLMRFNGTRGNYKSGVIIRASVDEGGVVGTDGLESQRAIAGAWHLLQAR